MSDHLRFVLLGPLEVWSGDVRLDIGPPKRRVLLTRLLIEEGRPVSAGRLCDDLWEGNPPAGAMSSIHAHVSRLRAVLEPQRVRRGKGTVLLSGPAGYMINASPQTRDARRFEEAVNHARGLAARGRLGEAHREVERGLSLWRGAALADAAGHAFATREIARLEEIRMAAGELSAGLLLQMGEPGKAALVAEELIARSPLREAAWALLMRALYLAGRPAEALHRFEAIRSLLADELGATPGPELADLHLAILRQDMAAVAPFRSHAAPARPPARQADATPPLVGRDGELARFDELLRDAGQGHTRWAVLSGEPGIGKTRLAEEFAARAENAEFRVEWVRCGTGVPGEDTEEAGDDIRPRALAGLFAMADLEMGLQGVARALDGEPAERPARQPTLLLIDDLHLADDGFHRRLGRCATFVRGEPVVIVCATQDTDDVGLRRLLALLVRQSRAAFMPLRPLTVEDVRQLMKRRSARFDGSSEYGGPDRRGPDRREAELVHRRGEGNPFLIAEILELPDGQRTGPGARIPASVIRVLRARLDLLDARVLRMIEEIAVTGGRLDAELLLQMRTITREELLSLIDAAVTARMLNWRDAATPGRPGYYVMPDLVRELVLHDLTPARGQTLHACAARALARLPGRHPVRIARHLMAAGPLITRDELIEAALRAGNRCAEDDQYADAEIWFDHATALADDPALRAKVRQRQRPSATSASSVDGPTIRAIRSASPVCPATWHSRRRRNGP